MKTKYFLVLSLLLVNFSVDGNEINKVSKNKILFTLSGMQKFGIGTIVKITDGSEEIGRARVIKVGKSKAVAKVFNGKGLVQKGYQVIIMVLKLSDRKIKRSNNKTSQNGSQSYVTRKIAILAGASFQSLGTFTGRDELDPITFGSYIGFKTEINYKFSQIGVLIGFDFHQGEGEVQMPALLDISDEEFSADGQMSDIYFGAQYFLDRFSLNNYYLTGMFIPIVGHKILKSLANGEELQYVYTGTGIGLGAGKEWIFDKWIMQANILYKSYSLTNLKDNLGSNTRSVSISHTVFSAYAMVGYHF
jgi:hypothetical protein